MLKLEVSFKSKAFFVFGSSIEGRKMKIGELAARANLKPSAIRYYEKMGILGAPHRVSGQRRYPVDALDRVLLIRFAGEMDFTLAEIKIFLAGLRDSAPVGPRWKKLAHVKIKQMDDSIKRSRQLKSLLAHLLHCECPSLQVCVQRLSLSRTMKMLDPRT
jgi:MerR family transcriptional regulator, redox-sensitive transcriptional activator SoxR